MNNKINAASKSIAISNKNILENNHYLPPSGLSSEGLCDCNKQIEIIVKAKGLKRKSTMVMSNPTSHKSIEEKKRPGNSGDVHQSWGKALIEQNKAVIKQGLQQFQTKTTGSKSLKHSSETKEIKKHSLNHQKPNHKHLDELPIKQSASQKRIEEHIKSIPRTTNPSSTSIPSTVESIIVYDKGVQCDGILEYFDDRFGVFNPVRTLHFLIKELEHLVKDDKANKILTNMEQALLRISMEPDKLPIVQELETKSETTRQMSLMCDALQNERDSLVRQNQEICSLLHENREKQLDLEKTVKTLKQELEETVKIRDKTIIELKEKIKNYEFSQKIISDLRTNLAEQKELLSQRYLEVQCITLEKDKFSALSLYKDSLLNDLRNQIKELQNCIADQLCNLKDSYIQEECPNPQISLVHGGRVCSSPTSTSSRDSNIRTSWHDISDISLSMDHNPSKIKNVQDLFHMSDKIPAFLEIQGETSENKQTKNIKEASTKDSANLDFISLPAGESSLTLLPSYKDLGCTEISKSVNKGDGDVITFSNKKNDNLDNFKNTNKISSLEHLNYSLQKKETDIKESSRVKKSLESNKEESSEKKSIVNEDNANILKDNLTHNLISSTITEQFQNIFQDIRIQSRMPVKVPSPPRNYPNPEWSDSTLPSISTDTG